MSAVDRKRFRARIEFDGIEVFDRLTGTVMPSDRISNQVRSQLDRFHRGQPPVTVEPGTEQLTSQIVENGGWNIEPLIDTDYRKDPQFASAPRRIYWELTRRCNLSCKACFNRTRHDEDEMTTEQILQAAETMYRAGVFEIRCTGGEPTMRRDFFRIVAELKAMGFYLSMGTNGVYAPETLQRVIDSPIDWIIVSIDGASEEVNAAVRGPGVLVSTLNTLRHLRDTGRRIRINTLIRRGNYLYEHLRPLAELCSQHAVESLNCIPLRPMTHDPEALRLQLSADEFRMFIQAVGRLRQEYPIQFVTTLDLQPTDSHDRVYRKDRSCAAGREGAVLSPYGELYGCSYSLASDPNADPADRAPYIAGNVLEEDFLDIWNDSPRWRIYRDLETYKHATCRQCQHYKDRRCIGNCPIMKEGDPAAFDPYCYLHAVPEHPQVPAEEDR